MRSMYSVAQAQNALPRLIRKAEAGEPVRILRDNKTVAYIVSRERMEAIVETLEVLSNPEAVKAIAEHRAARSSSCRFRCSADSPDEGPPVAAGHRLRSTLAPEQRRKLRAALRDLRFGCCNDGECTNRRARPGPRPIHTLSDPGGRWTNR